MVMITEELFTRIVNFMNPGVGVLVLWCGHISYKVKIHYFFKIFYLFSKAQIRQTNSILMMSTKIVNFMTSGARILVLGCGQISHIVKMYYFCKNLHLFTQA